MAAKTLVACLGAAAVGAVALLRLWKLRASRTRWLRVEDVEQFVDKYDTWLLDCDGVIWLGEEAVPGVPETLAELRRRGKRIFFVSNNASKHRATYLTKFQKMGIEASVEDVVTSAIGAAQFCLNRCGEAFEIAWLLEWCSCKVDGIKSRPHSKMLLLRRCSVLTLCFDVSRYGKGAKVYVCGTSGLIQEFAEVGLTVVEPKYVLDTSTSSSGPALVGDDLDKDIRAVVAAADWTLTHRKLSYATVCLTSIPGCELIATNRDRLLAGASR